jgi:hypothetical protein
MCIVVYIDIFGVRLIIKWWKCCEEERERTLALFKTALDARPRARI